MDPNSYHKGITGLVEEGVAIRVRHGHVDLDGRWRLALRSRLDAAGNRPALDPAGSILCKAMRDAGPLAEADLAARSGLDSATLALGLGTLRATGRVVEVEAGRFMVA